VMYDRNLDRNWRQNKAVLTIVIEHKPYWDSSVEIQVPLSNRNGEDDLSGLTVYNHTDGDAGHDNFVKIKAADVQGDLPGLTRLELVNNYSNINSRLSSVWVGQNWTDPDNFSHIIEGESSSTGTEGSAVDCSNGKYRYYACPSGYETDMFTWDLSAAYLDACQGSFFKILARFNGYIPLTIKYRIKLKFLLTTVWQSSQVTLDTNVAMLIRDLFTFRLPPWLLGQQNLMELQMVLTGQQNTGSPQTVGIDFLQITPLDGWRMMKTTGYGVIQNDRLVDDGVNEVCYVDDGAGAYKGAYLVVYGKPIELYPNKNQRLYFLQHSCYANAAEVNRTLSVKLFYRPRRRCI